MATLLVRNKQSSYRETAKPCREGPQRTFYGEVESKDGLRACKQQYDIIEVFPDNVRNFGLSGSRGREDTANGMGNFVHLRIKIPGIPTSLKYFIEAPHTEWAANRKYGEFRPINPELRLPRRYYVDIDSLPDFAKENLRFAGECTLTPEQAYRVIKRRSDDSNAFELLTNIEAIE